MHMQPVHVSVMASNFQQLEARHGVERVNSHVHLHVPAACALYDAPEDGYILHPKHVEQEKCNKVPLNNLHQAGLNKPRYLRLLCKRNTSFGKYNNTTNIP